jgi:hypothetical protein
MVAIAEPATVAIAEPATVPLTWVVQTRGLMEFFAVEVALLDADVP